MAAALLLTELADDLPKLKEFSVPVDINTLDDEGFRKHFRLPPSVYREVCTALEAELGRRDDHNRSMTMFVEQQLLLALRFFGTGGYQQCIAGDKFIQCSQGQVSKIIHRVTDAIIGQLGYKVSMPSTAAEKEKTKVGFYDLQNCHLHGVLGAVDGTLVQILAPPANHKESTQGAYYSHKCFFAINPMVICDAITRISYVDPRFPGSTHDSFVWKASVIKADAAQYFLENEWLLGDSGYPLEPWLMTPISHPGNNAERHYNRAHRSARNVVERTIGILKMRFRCLTRQRHLMYLPGKCAKIFHACAILHNMCMDAKDNIQLPAPDPRAAPTLHLADNFGNLISEDPERREPATATLLNRGVICRRRLANSFN